MKLTPPPLKKRTILVVEDNDDVQAMICALLEQHGFAVDIADSGMTALGATMRNLPDLILLDMAMPDMDGFEFLRRRALRPELKAIPVIVVSARDTGKDVTDAIALGADNYVAKPFDNRRLLDSVHALLPQRRLTGVNATEVRW